MESAKWRVTVVKAKKKKEEKAERSKNKDGKG